MALSKKQLHDSLALIHPNLYLDRLGERLAKDGAKVIDRLFDLALKSSDDRTILSCIDKIATLSGATAYAAALATAMAKKIAGEPTNGPAALPEGEDDADALADRAHLESLLSGDADPQPGPAVPVPEPTGVEEGSEGGGEAPVPAAPRKAAARKPAGAGPRKGTR